MSRPAAGRRPGDGRPSVLFLNRVYPPDPGASGQLAAELAGALARRGWRTGVLACGGPGGPPRREERGGVLVRRAWALPLTRKTPLRRLAAYLSAWPAMLAELGRLGGWDACVVMTDPPLLPVLGPAARRLLSRPGRPCRLAAWVQDLHPDLAEGIGVLRPGAPTSRLLRAASRQAHARADQVICIGRCMWRRLALAGTPLSRLSVIPNWSDPVHVRPAPAETNAWRRARGLADCFLVMYAGNMGHFHRFAPFLEAAERLRAVPAGADVRFAFVGDGVRAAALRAQAQARGLDNVLFLPPRPYEELSELLGAADLHLASMRDELLGCMAPSKVYGALAAGRPCLFLGPAASEPARTLLERDCGQVVQGAEDVVRAVLAWQGDADRRREAGRRAREAALDWGLPQAAERFERTLLDLIAS